MNVPVPLVDRFWPKVNKNSGHFGADGKYPTECHEWIAYLDSYGYGRIGSENHGPTITAHRAAWILQYGSIPKNKCVLHKCDNPPCIRYDHLFLGSKADNIKDMNEKGRANPTKGENNHFAKLNESQVIEIRKLFKNGCIQAELGRMFGCSRTAINRIVHYKSWKHIEN